MKKHFWVWIFALALSFMAITVRAQVVPGITPFPLKADGQTVFASDWNNIATITSWINNTLLSTSAGLNCLSAQGDMYIFNGANLQRLAGGTAGQVLTASASSPGAAWAAVANLATLTTNGDTLFYNSGSNQRLPIGSSGQVLTVSGGLPSWQNSTSSIPVGTIIAWSPSAAGTNTIPTSWCLCDGQPHATHSNPGVNVTPPNLIGRFIIGSKPTGSGATPSAGGFGNQTVDTAVGVTSHAHTNTVSPGTTIVTAGADTTVLQSVAVTINGQTVLPASYAEVYLCFTN